MFGLMLQTLTHWAKSYRLKVSDFFSTKRVLGVAADWDNQPDTARHWKDKEMAARHALWFYLTVNCPLKSLMLDLSIDRFDFQPVDLLRPLLHVHFIQEQHTHDCFISFGGITAKANDIPLKMYNDLKTAIIAHIDQIHFCQKQMIACKTI